ncbi:MAG: DUF2911 domain-containing protein [Gemmatimonadales bacterium]
MTCAPWYDSTIVANRPSPYDSIMLRSDTSLQAKLCYSKPLARGRVVFGGLVPYDTLWRTGANEATILHLAQPTEIAGMSVDAGDYSIYTVPNPEQWQVVVNGAAGHWGLTRDEVGADGIQYYNAYTPDIRAQEIGRAPIAVETIPFVEQLTASFETTSPTDHRLLFDWETTRIVIPLRIPQPSP